MVQTSDLDAIKNYPTVFVIFGATGDLAKKRIFPSLYQLSKNNLLPTTFKLIATARTEHTTEKFRELILEMIPKVDYDAAWKSFAQKIEYIAADVAEDKNLNQVKKALDDFESKTKDCTNRVYYMAIAPNIIEKAVNSLGKNNLHLGCTLHEKSPHKPRIIIEKPHGTDLESARTLGKTLSKYFSEDQIYRIDHYLGKETVQNIFAFRFGNELFEPTWNNKYIDHIQITTAEHIGVDTRGEFYDKTGALRDMIQNHLLQLLTLVTMEEPETFEAKSIAQKKLEVLKQMKKPSTEDLIKNTVRGQYNGYLYEPKIDPKSQTESYALVKLFIENERWNGVPFYLRTGKKLMGKVTSIIIQFKEHGHKLFENFWEKPLPNHITLQIQPNEGIGIRLVAKKPGLTTLLEPVDMEFCYKTSFDQPQPEAYERLMLDVIAGDQSLFLPQDIIEQSWKIIDPIRQVWDSGKTPLVDYEPGEWGPTEADKLIEADGRQWLTPLLSICKI